MPRRSVQRFDGQMGLRILRARKALGLTQHEFAARLGVTQPTVHRWEKGAYDPDEMTLQALAALTKLPPAFFRYGDDLPSEQQQVPLVGHVGAGALVYPIDDHAKGAGLELVEAPPAEARTVVAVAVEGDSMYPAYQDGDLIYFSRSGGVDEAAVLGRECVVRERDGPTLVKRVTRGERRGTYTLISYNAPPMADRILEWAAPVRWVKRR